MVTALKNRLTLEESDRLIRLEMVIKRGFSTFYEVGLALMEISDKRLYRETHSTFDEYCREKWNVTANRAYRLCQAAEVVKALPEKCCQLATNEAQARELAKIPEKERPALLEVVAAKGPVTAKAIREAAAPAPRPLPTPPEAQLGNLKAARVLKSFDTWLGMNFPIEEERQWTLGLLADHIEDLRAAGREG